MTKDYGPSPAALAAAFEHTDDTETFERATVRSAVYAAHDPALGAEASVNRGAFVQEIVAWLRSPSFQGETAPAFADLIERRFEGDRAR